MDVQVFTRIVEDMAMTLRMLFSPRRLHIDREAENNREGKDRKRLNQLLEREEADEELEPREMKELDRLWVRTWTGWNEWKEKPLLDMISRELWDELDELNAGIVDQSMKLFVEEGSEEMREDYWASVEELLDEHIAKKTWEKTDEMAVADNILDKLTWWRKCGRRGDERMAYPLLTPSLIPVLAECLDTVGNAMSEVSVLCFCREEGRMAGCWRVKCTSCPPCDTRRTAAKIVTDRLRLIDPRR